MEKLNISMDHAEQLTNSVRDTLFILLVMNSEKSNEEISYNLKATINAIIDAIVDGNFDVIRESEEFALSVKEAKEAMASEDN
jgi:hypothetical protein